MKRIKYIITLLLIIIPVKVSALNGYTIESYDVDIIVSEDNIYNITETITTNFEISKHGIIRNIPIENEVKRLDGTTTKNYAKISNLKVSDNYSTSKSNGKYSIKIGDANRTFTGKHTYTIKYTYNIGNDKLEDKDEFYFNIIGNEWDTTISNITFRIEMPDSFDEDKLGFSKGSYGSTENKKIYYEVDDNIIAGYCSETLDSYEGLTVRLELEEGYFKKQPISKTILLLYVIPIISLIISIYLWFKYGRDEQVVETVEFYPPEGFNSLELGFLYHGTAENEDAISLLIYLANKGYLKITEIEKKSTFLNTKSYEITKLKEYDGDNLNEKIFFDGLFNKKDTITESDLHNKFYITISKILNNINKKENRNRIFEKNTTKIYIMMILMMVIIFCLETVIPFIYYGDYELLIFALVFPGIGFGGMLASLIINSRKNNGTKFLKVFLLIWRAGFAILPWIFIVLPILKNETMFLYSYIVGLLSILLMAICIKYLPKRTPYGNEMLGKINGFKNFLETAEKEKLEMMVNENPTYFYDILPYTYVLGISKKWISKFESIAISSPTWYSGMGSFNYNNFSSFMNTTMSNVSLTMSSSPSNSSSGSSGGGFSGGGSGGGGGSSW